jgi:hypothetical protein
MANNLTQKQIDAIKLFKFQIENHKKLLSGEERWMFKSIPEDVYIRCSVDIIKQNELRIKNIEQGTIVKYSSKKLKWYNTLGDCLLNECKSLRSVIYKKTIKCYCGLDDCLCDDYKIEIEK